MSSPSDEERFTLMLEQNRKIIFKVCNFYCINIEDRKDLAQEIIIQLWLSFGKYNSQFKISTWIYRIALNVSISYYRRGKRNKNNLPLSADSFTIHDIGDDTEELEMNTLLLYRFINELDKLNKALMILYLDSYSYKEIADILGISETNVSTKINRIKQKLKHQFQTSSKI